MDKAFSPKVVFDYIILMPTYDFVNTETGEEFEQFMSISAREEFLKTNPHIQQVLGATSTVSGVLAKVSENHKQSSVANRHGKKSISESQTQRIVDKHLGKFGR